MRILVIGAGGVGASIASIAQRRSFFDHLVLADVNLERAQGAVQRLGDRRFSAARVDATDRIDLVDLARRSRADVIVNACDPRCNPPIFDAALTAGCHYVDMAMHMSVPHHERPYERCGVRLGDVQLAGSDAWAARGLLALCGMGVEPGLSDVFARYAADELFSEVHEVGVRDGSSLAVDGYPFAPTFSIWTVIEECLNPPVVWERDRGWFTTEPFSEPEVFEFPGGIGPVECVNVEHEEVLLIPRWVDCRRVTFKYGLGQEFIDVLRTLHTIGLDRTQPVRVGNVEVSPRDLVAALLPNPAELGERMRGRTCAGTWVTGLDAGGDHREVYLYQVVDNADTMREYGHQAVVWQTAVNPVVALELLATGRWSATGVLGPEAMAPVPFLDLLTSYGASWVLEDRTPGGAPARPELVRSAA
jgi:saccharopine dehydrogenase-like NADP-dependent oxidoreductase